MYSKKNIDVIPYFHIEVGYALKKDIIQHLIKRYRNVKVLWSDFEVTIRTDDGIFSGITINLGIDFLKVFKNNRENENQFTFLYFDRTFKTVRELRNCDSFEEYDWLNSNIINKFINVLNNFNENGLGKKYILQKEIQLETRFSYDEHFNWCLRLERFSKEIVKIYGYEVIFSTFPYHSMEFYRYGRVGNLEITLNDGVIFNFDYNQVSDRVNIASNNRKKLYEHEALLVVAKRLHDVKTYTSYDRKIMKEEAEKLGVNLKW